MLVPDRRALACSLLLLAPIAGACAGVASPPAAPAGAETPTRFTVPEQVGALRITDRETFADPSAGAVYRYGGGEALPADVFVFPREAAETLTMQTAAFLEGLEIQRLRRQFDAYEVEEDAEMTVSRGGEAVTGRRIRVLLSRGSEHRRSHFYLFPVGGDWVKVRVTHAPEAATSEEVDRFVHLLLASE